MASYKNFWKNYFYYSGIATRKDMWIILLFHTIITVILGIINSKLTSIYAFLIFIPNITLSIRRLRDGGHSAKPLIFVYILNFACFLLMMFNYLFSWIPVIGWITTLFFVWLPRIIMFCASIYLFILLYCKDSTIRFRK